MLSTLKKLALYFVVIVCSQILVACASQPEPDVSSRDHEMEAELEEWKKLKPGVQRLVAIESELKGLLSALEGIVVNEPTARLETVNDGHNVQTQTIEPVVFAEKKMSEPPVLIAQVEQPQRAVSTDNKLTAPNAVGVSVAEVKATKKAEEQKTAAVAESKAVIDSQASAEQPVAAQTSTFSLQLASVTQEQAVNQTWVRLKKRYPDVLGSLDFHSEQVLVANKTYYRVKAGRFDSYNEAKQSCRLLLSSGASCIVNKG